jgi:hypothetical protein
MSLEESGNATRCQENYGGILRKRLVREMDRAFYTQCIACVFE